MAEVRILIDGYVSMVKKEEWREMGRNWPGKRWSNSGWLSKQATFS